MFLNIPMPSVICVWFSQLVDHYVTLHNTFEHILVRALECQVSLFSTNDEVVDHWRNLAYASKKGKWHIYACDTKYHHKQCSPMSIHLQNPKMYQNSQIYKIAG